MASSKRSLLQSSLPLDMIEEILYRIPTESLIRFKSTCKDWYALITNKRLMYKHLDHSPERFMRIYDHQMIDPVTGTLSVSVIPDALRDSYPIYTMVHCDGLMLCLCIDWTDRQVYTNLAIWNPFLRKFKWIKPSVCYRTSDYFGIGYNNTVSRDNYKILRLVDPWHIRKADYSDPDCEVYEFKSDSWRTLGAKFDWVVDAKCRGVSVKGNMYWIAVKKEEDEDLTRMYGQRFIISFDFSIETFKDIWGCPRVWVSRLACFNGDRLSLLQQGEESPGIQVWMTNKLSDGVVSFSQYFNVTTPDLPYLHMDESMARPGYSIGKHRNIRVWCEESVEVDNKEYVCIKFYEIDEGGIIKQMETGIHGKFGYDDPYICSYVYVPSLIPIPRRRVQKTKR